jgi:hypothetical protein
MAERAVNCSDLQDEEFGFIPRLFAQQQWDYFVLPPARPYVELVCEFYANIKGLSKDPLRLVTFVRGQKIEVTEDLITSITGIPKVEDPGYPFPTLEFPSKQAMYPVFSPTALTWHWHDYMNVLSTDHLTQPKKLLARIMLINIYPLDHHSDLGVPRARFLYALLTDASIDFPSFALRLMYETFDEKSTSLPFGSLISRICEHFITIHGSEPKMKPLGPFSRATVRRSLGQMKVRHQTNIDDILGVDPPPPSFSKCWIL